MDPDLYKLHRSAMVQLMNSKAITYKGRFFSEEEFQQNKKEIFEITSSARKIEEKLKLIKK